jgi:putative vitamin uptake transporter
MHGIAQELAVSAGCQSVACARKLGGRVPFNRVTACSQSLTGPRGLWLRNGLSVLTLQVADTAIFYTVAFYGVVPNDVLPFLVLGTILVKATFAALGIPVVYLLVRWITGEWTASGDLGRRAPGTVNKVETAA